MGCETGLNFNHSKGPEKLMVGGEGVGVGGGARTHRDWHKQTLLRVTLVEKVGGAPGSAGGSIGPGLIPIPGL